MQEPSPHRKHAFGAKSASLTKPVKAAPLPQARRSSFDHASLDEDLAGAAERAQQADDDEPEREDVSHNTQEWLDRTSGQ